MAAAGQAASGWFLPCSCALLLKPRQNEAPVRCLKPGPWPAPIGRACPATSEIGANSRALNAALRNIYQDLMLWIE